MGLAAFQSLMRPLLVLLEGGEDRSVEEIRSALSKRFDHIRIRAASGCDNTTQRIVSDEPRFSGNRPPSANRA